MEGDYSWVSIYPTIFCVIVTKLIIISTFLKLFETI